MRLKPSENFARRGYSGIVIFPLQILKPRAWLRHTPYLWDKQP
jgi:hypothetical protein